MNDVRIDTCSIATCSDVCTIVQSDECTDAQQHDSCSAPPEICIYREDTAPWILPFCQSELQRILAEMLRVANDARIGVPIVGIDLYMTSDRDIAEKNALYMRCTGPTNILSFPGGDALAGTLVLSLQTFERECFLYGQEKDAYLIHLIAHGMAHLAELEHGALHDRVHDACVEAGMRLLADPRTRAVPESQERNPFGDLYPLI